MKKIILVVVALIGARLFAMALSSVDDRKLQLSIFRSDTFVPARIAGAKPDPTHRSSGHYAATHIVFLKNIGKSEVRVPVLPASEEAKLAQFGPMKDGRLEERYVFTFDLSPAPDGSVLINADQFVTLRPGESTTMPYFLGTADAGERLPCYTVVYRVSRAYGERHQCWSGELTATQEAIALHEKSANSPNPTEPTPKSVTAPAEQEPRQP